MTSFCGSEERGPAGAKGASCELEECAALELPANDDVDDCADVGRGCVILGELYSDVYGRDALDVGKGLDPDW